MFFNEHDAYAAQWIRNLFPLATVDERSIHEVQARDLEAYSRVHLFGGIAGWELALQLAGWPQEEEVWTGSCPCQPYSLAGRHQGDKDARNLWPQMFRLIRKRRPVTVFGEQVASAIGHGWLDGISADLEREGYTVGAVVLGAHSVGAPHVRQRLFWVADDAGRRRRDGRGGANRRLSDAEGSRCHEQCGDAKCEEGTGWKGNSIEPADGGAADRLAEPEGAERRTDKQHVELRAGRKQDVGASGGSGAADGLADLSVAGHEGRQRSADAERSKRGGRLPAAGGGPPDLLPDAERDGRGSDFEVGQADRRAADGRDHPWHDFLVIPCHDGKSRRVSAQPGHEPLAHGIPLDVVSVFPELAKLVKGARNNRVSRLRGYGNAIVPQVAAVFIQAVMEARL